MKLIILLQQALLSLESLKEYYFSQNEIISKIVDEKSEKYKYGVALERYLFAKATNMDELLNDEDGENCRKIAEKMIRDLNIDDDEIATKISYRLEIEEEIAEEYELDPNKASREYRKIIEMPILFNNSTIMMLLIKYEEAIAGLFEYAIRKYPNAYLKEKTVTYTEIMEINDNVQNIKQFFCNKEVEEIMHLGISDWYKLLSDKHKVNFDSLTDETFNTFKEIYYRRNIIVHNNGKINKTYLCNLPSELTKNMRIGDEISCGNDYMQKAFDMTYMMLYGTFLSMIKICDEPDKLKKLIFDNGFQHMIQHEWNISAFIFGNLLKVKPSDNSDLELNKINYWISMKNLLGYEYIKDEVLVYDVSVLSVEYKIAKAALCEEFNKVNLLLEDAIEREIPAYAVATWPLFNQYRESDEYQYFKNKHKDEFELLGYEPENIEYESSEDNEDLINKCEKI